MVARVGGDGGRGRVSIHKIKRASENSDFLRGKREITEKRKGLDVCILNRARKSAGDLSV